MPQFFIRSGDIIDNKCRITGDDFRHLVAVRRARPGDTIKLRDEAGALLSGRISDIGGSYIEVEVQGEAKGARRQTEINLYMGLLKGKGFDEVIEKAVEVGVSRIIPVVSERTIPRPSGVDEKLRRWNRKALEAAKQCMRESVPEVADIRTFNEAIDSALPGIRMIAHPCMGADLKGFLRSNPSDSASLLIGPEGGFSGKEIDLAATAGWDCVHFGFTQLRAGTAAVVLCGIIIYELGMGAP